VTPSVALLLSIALILVLLRLKVHPGPAVFAGGLLLSLIVLPPAETPRAILKTASDLQTWRLIGIIICAFALSKMMEQRGMLTRLAHTLESIGPKIAMHVVPSVIGMVPMPGGALVSATDEGPRERLKLAPAQSTYINYWFRHIWELAVPVYPSVIAASVVLAVPLSTVVVTMLPVIPLMAALGGVVSWRILRNAPPAAAHSLTGRDFARELLRAAWPVLLLVAMVLAGLEAVFAFLLAAILLGIQQRFTSHEVKVALRYAFGWKVLFLLFAVMVYKEFVDASGAAYSLFTDMQAAGIPPAAILVALPLLIGFAAGLSMAFVGIAFPLILPFITTADGLNFPRCSSPT
jgi:integral membrane protein (TIGR00529 family)